MSAPAGATPGYHAGEQLFILITLMPRTSRDGGDQVMIPRIDEEVFPWLALPPSAELLQRLNEGQELYCWIYVKKHPRSPVAFMRVVTEENNPQRAQISFNFLGKGWKPEDDVPVLEREAWSATVRILLRTVGFGSLVTGVLDPEDSVARNLLQAGFQRAAEDNFMELAPDMMDAAALAQPAVAARLVEKNGKRFLRIAVFELARTQLDKQQAANN